MSSNQEQVPVLPPENLHHVVITATCFAFVLSTTAVGLRLYSRHLVGSRLFLDDYLMIGALVNTIVLCKVAQLTCADIRICSFFGRSRQ